MKEENENITAFAYFTAKEIERIINKETNNLKETNQTLEAMILVYRHNLNEHLENLEFLGYKDTADKLLEQYDKHFNIAKYK